jgi:hypothetical protein
MIDSIISGTSGKPVILNQLISRFPLFMMMAGIGAAWPCANMPF